MKARAIFLLISLPGALACREPNLFGECGDTIKAEVSSPDGRYVAAVFERNCGATTDYSTLVTLRETSQPFAPKKQGWVLALSGQVDVTLAWSSDRVIRVGAEGGEVFRKEPTWRDVRISYDN